MIKIIILVLALGSLTGGIYKVFIEPGKESALQIKKDQHQIQVLKSFKRDEEVKDFNQKWKENKEETKAKEELYEPKEINTSVGSHTLTI